MGYENLQPRSGDIYVAHSVSCGNQSDTTNLQPRSGDISKRSLPHVFLIARDPVLSQKCSYLVLKADASMMILLVVDISHDAIDAGSADAERRIPFLSCKFWPVPIFMNPLRRV